MQAIETTGSFNEKGKLEIDNLPVIRNKKVKLLILFEENERDDWYQLSGRELSGAYGEDEPDYTLNMLSEPNPDYKP